MPELTREEKLKLIEKLPQRLQDFLYSEDTGAFLLYIGKKYNLPNEKVSALAKIVADIILNITQMPGLAQEIANKVIPDSQAAMAIAQELNNGLLMPILAPVPMAPPPAPQYAYPAPTYIAPVPAVPVPSRTDQYREPNKTVPEIVDLRKIPQQPVAREGESPENLKNFGEIGKMPVIPAPIPPSPIRSFSEGGQAPRPLTFTRPVEKPKPFAEIEAEPHKIFAPVPPTSPPPAASREEPQFIIRPPGLAPTDMPHDVLDLRRDRGEF